MEVNTGAAIFSLDNTEVNAGAAIVSLDNTVVNEGAAIFSLDNTGRQLHTSTGPYFYEP
jgi:hypothetical protein